MKKLLGILLAALLVFTILAGSSYLKEEKPDIYNKILETLDWITPPQEEHFKVSNNNLKIENDKASGITGIPITENAKNNIPQEQLRAVQRTDMIPVEGTGEEIDEASISLVAGDVGADYSFSELMYPYRGMLNREEQSAYNQIYANAVNYNSSPFAMQASISASEIDNIMIAVYNDHPKLFWLETQYGYQYGRNGKVYTVTLKFNETISDITGNVDRFNQKVNEIINLASTYGSDVEKERFIHDYLIAAATYDESARMHQSAYSALVNGKSVCAGYSRAFQHLMMQMGIPTYYCTGVADGGPHAWNIIKLGNDFYNVDALWNDSLGERYNTQSYLYFNIPDSEFNREHRRTGLSVNLPACNGTAMSYESVFGGSAMGDMLSSYGLSKEDILYSLKEYYTYCERALTRAGVGQSNFTVVLTDKKLFDEIYYDVSREGYVDGYMRIVAENLGLTNYSISLQFSSNELPDGHVILSQETKLTSK